MPTQTGNLPQSGLPDSDFAGTSPALEDLMSAESVARAVAESAAAPPPPNPQPAQECVQEVDLGDGSGVQVFKGASWEEVAKKLAEAQKNATKRIRELSQRPTGLQPENKSLFQPVEYKPRDLTQAEQLRIADDMSQGNMTRAFDQLIESRLGVKPNELANGMNLLQTLYRDKLEQNATANWSKRHQGEYWQFDFIPSLTRISQKLLEAGYPITETNLEWSYNQLVAAGEILVEEPQDETPAPPPAQPAAPPEPSRRTPAPTFVVSDRSGQRMDAQVRRPEVDVAALTQLPLDQMRTQIEARLKAGR